MSKRWIIHLEDGGYSGPFSAAEIREALRKGELDPATKVSIEGSAIKREIFGTDELFNTSESAQFQGDANATQIVKEIKNKDSYLGLAAPGKVSPDQPSPTKEKSKSRDSLKSSKKYFLISSSGKTSSYMTTAEILSLYERGKIPVNSRVGKVRTKSSIPLRQFVRVYRSGKSKHSAPGPKSEAIKNSAYHHRSKPVGQSTFTSFSALSSGVGPRTLGALGGAFILLALSLWAISSKDKISAFLYGEQDSRVPQLPSGPPPTVKLDESFQNQQATKKTRPKTSIKTLGGSSTRNHIAQAAPTDLPGVPIGSLKNLRKLTGKLVIFGPLSFSPKDLNSCTIKCNLSMMDKDGKEVVVIFFKAAYIGQLSGKETRIYIQATVDSAGKTLYLSKVF